MAIESWLSQLQSNGCRLTSARKAVVKTMASTVSALSPQEVYELAQVTCPGRPGPDPRGCLPQLMAIREAYPELKANDAFLRLQRELADTEQRIALAREYFNAIAAFHNRRRAIVPDTFICRLAGLRPQPFIAAADFERAAVRVDLADRPH